MKCDYKSVIEIDFNQCNLLVGLNKFADSITQIVRVKQLTVYNACLCFFFLFQIRTYLNAISRPSGELDLQTALAEAKSLFDEASPRPNAQKVLVVIMDKKSIDTEEGIQEALKPLKDDDVKIVPVAIGTDADVNELKNITSAEGYLVKAEKTTDPKKLAEKIMSKVTSGMRV